MMSLDLAEVSQCVLPGNNRNEVELQFPESDAIEANNDQLVSIRFYIPPDPEVDPSDRSVKSSAELLQQRIMQMANIRKTTGDVIGTFAAPVTAFLAFRTQRMNIRQVLIFPHALCFSKLSTICSRIRLGKGKLSYTSWSILYRIMYVFCMTFTANTTF